MGIGLNSRLEAITGQTKDVTKQPIKVLDVETGLKEPTFFESGMPAISDLLPNVTHRVRRSYILPMGQEEVDLNLETRLVMKQTASRSEYFTRRISSKAAAKGENTSYAMFSTVSDFTIC